MRFSDDVVGRREFEEGKEPLHFSGALWLKRHPEADNASQISAEELFVLLQEDRRAQVLDRLERMEKHYAEVALLDRREVARRLSEAAQNDPGILPFRQVLVNGEDPRRAIAESILRQIPVARRHVALGREALELIEIERLNALANDMLTMPHARRGVRILAQENIDRADKVLWVEGPHDVPVFQTWLLKSPEIGDQSVAVLPVAGHQSASRHFDVKQLLKVNPNCLVILDSERTAPGGKPDHNRLKVARRFVESGVPHMLTERRATENYFPVKALTLFYTGVPDEIDPFRKLNEQIVGFSKHDNGSIAEAMEWPEIASSDIGRALVSFLKGRSS